MLEQIRDRQIDLCQEDYHRYIRIGLALYDKFGSGGSEQFHFVCQYGAKYNEKDATKDWKGLCSNNSGKVKIGTFYYYYK
ncbi:PriCT-2 domain-containing protein, partial [Lacticaseibacillus paracasei]